tara:strand:+ start:1329 stop:1901 length:573 start_codon:yes stop_codon:yes gene_type:complete
VQSDLTLIDKIKDRNDEESLLELINRHSGIYHTMINQFLSSPQNSIDKTQAVKEKDYVIYNSAVNFDPNKNTKFSTYLANQAKWKCLNILSKKKRINEYSIEDLSLYHEPSSESFLNQINKEEAFDLFQDLLNEESDPRVREIIELRYNVNSSKLNPWRKIAKKLDMSIQGCINIHNRFINKVKKEINYV